MKGRRPPRYLAEDTPSGTKDKCEGLSQEHAWHVENNQAASAAGMECSDGRARGEEVHHAGLEGHTKDAGFSLEMRSQARGLSSIVTGSDLPFNRLQGGEQTVQASAAAGRAIGFGMGEWIVTQFPCPSPPVNCEFTRTGSDLCTE